MFVNYVARECSGGLHLDAFLLDGGRTEFYVLNKEQEIVICGIVPDINAAIQITERISEEDKFTLN